MTEPLLTLKQVTKTYQNGTVALSPIDLSIRSGEFVSLVGPSGCGKSTVLRLAAGLGQPSSGRLIWHQSQQLAFVFQDAALMPWATVLENVYLPLRLSGQRRRAARPRIQQAINTVELNGFEQRYPRQLSGGMKMRVSIARALVTDPQVLLMDEPFGALDEMTRSRLNRDLLTLWEQRRWTVLFITHNIYEAVYLSSRVVVMTARPGQIAADIPIQEPYPRSQSFRTSSAFNRYCRQVLAALEQAEPETPWLS